MESSVGQREITIHHANSTGSGVPPGMIARGVRNEVTEGTPHLRFIADSPGTRDGTNLAR